MAWPEETTDTVLYEEKKLIADRDMTLRMIDGTKAHFEGEAEILADIDIVGDLSVTGDISTTNLNASGDISTNDLTASGNVTAKHLEVHADPSDVYSFQLKRTGDPYARLAFHYANWLQIGDGATPPDCSFMRLGAGYMQVQAFIQFLSRIDVIGPLTAAGDFAHQGTNLGFYNAPWVTKPTGVTAAQALVNLGLLASPVAESAAPIRRTIKADTTTAYAPILTDENQMVTLSNAAAVTVTLPQNSTQAFPVGAEVDFLWLGAGQPTFAAGSGATANATPGLKMRAQYSAATAKKISTNGWVVIGDLSA